MGACRCGIERVLIISRRLLDGTGEELVPIEDFTAPQLLAIFDPLRDKHQSRHPRNDAEHERIYGSVLAARPGIWPST